MARNVGKQEWRAEPGLARQFEDGRNHLTCSKCHASLGDALAGKGEQKYLYCAGMRRQLIAGCRELTCPRCSFVVGEVYWLPPTVLDRIKHLFTHGITARTQVITSAAIASPLAGMLVFTFCKKAITVGLPHYSWHEIFILLTAPILVFLIAILILSPFCEDCRPGTGNDEDWWYWYHRRH